MIRQFKCERLHYILNTNYIVAIYKDKLTIGKESHPKYEYKFKLENVLHWYVDNLKLQAFGIEYKGIIKFFKANYKDLEQLRSFCRNLICFDNIVELYKQIDINNPSRIQDQISLQLCGMKIVTQQQLLTQVPLIRQLNYNGIISYRECFQYKSQYYIITEFVGEITLQKFIIQNPKLSHLQCRAIILQLFKTVQYLHDNYVIHATIDINHIIYKSDFIKIIDFSQAKYTNILDDYDIKNCSRILFYMYTGKEYNDIDNEQNQQTLQNTQTPKLAQELILSIMTDKNLTVSQILEHPYFSFSLDPQERKKRFQKFQRIQRSTSEMDDSDAISQSIPELQTNKSKSLRQLM
ncbi:unnamed protein product [Paramecium primaurelia]|uniref:Protein kinase domain-containing protein n=1 Tax=Paramecium primaurelia TaxID=5886 RepID=A0A8S1NGR5_PARPR|nr:unnamed protein product [Paramecium primaurelia]